MSDLLSAALRGKHLQSLTSHEAAKTEEQVALLSGEAICPISLDGLLAIAEWKEAVQARIQSAWFRLNHGLPDSDPLLATEVAEFASECQRLCAELRDARRRRAT